jgi:hypothetical protein
LAEERNKGFLLEAEGPKVKETEIFFLRKGFGAFLRG